MIWDGVNAHLVLFGAGNEEIEYPDMLSRIGHIRDEGEGDDSFYDDETIESDDFEGENDGLEGDAFFEPLKTDWGEGSK